MPDAKPRIAVTGATGVVGGQVAARIAAAGLRQRLVVRDDTRAPRLAGAEIRVASNYGAFVEMRAAFEDVDTVLLISGAKSTDRVAQHKAAVDAAEAAGVRRLTYLSFVGAARDAIFDRAVEHWETEQHIRRTQLEWTFLRMNLFIDLLPTMVHPDGAIRGPAGTGRLAAVARSDVADAAAAVLLSDEHLGRVYDLTGPESLSLGEAAERMARFTRTPIRFEDETDAEAFASRSGFGAPEWIVRGWISSYWSIRAGVLAEVSDAVRVLTGRDPITLEEYLRAHPTTLAHVNGTPA